MTEPIRDWNQRYVEANTPWDSGEPSPEMVRLFDELAIEPCRLLEIGCGSGTNAIFLAERGFDVVALDVAPLAIETAKKKAADAGIDVDFRVADLLDPAAALRLASDGPFPLVFDRGVYHVLRRENLEGFLAALRRVTSKGSRYVLLAGNANDPSDVEEGPPQVHAHELAAELAPLFDLVQLREFHFDKVVIDGKPLDFLGWSAVLRRR